MYGSEYFVSYVQLLQIGFKWALVKTDLHFNKHRPIDLQHLCNSIKKELGTRRFISTISGPADMDVVDRHRGKVMAEDFCSPSVTVSKKTHSNILGRLCIKPEEPIMTQGWGLMLEK